MGSCGRTRSQAGHEHRFGFGIFWFLFASSSGFGVTGDFSKNKLQYDIANVRQLPISYKVFRLRKTKSYKNSNFGKLYAVGGCNSLCRIIERKIIENYLRNNNHGLDDVQGKYGHFLRDRRSEAEEDVQMLPWEMEYFTPRLS